MPRYKIICTIEVETEAEDWEEAEAIGIDCMDWSNANYETLEVEEDEGC